MTAAHTPGPWAIETEGSSFYVVTPTMMVASPSPMDPHPHDDDEFIDGPVTEANARLIAAAPCLLEALRGLDEAYCRAGTPLTRDERNEDRKRLIAARAALAKATGGGT